MATDTYIHDRNGQIESADLSLPLYPNPSQLQKATSTVSCANARKTAHPQFTSYPAQAKETTPHARRSLGSQSSSAHSTYLTEKFVPLTPQQQSSLPIYPMLQIESTYPYSTSHKRPIPSYLPKTHTPSIPKSSTTTSSVSFF